MRRLLLCLIVFMIAVPAASGTKARRDEACPLVAMLSAYVAQTGGFPRLDTCPRVVFSPTARGTDGPKQDRLSARVFGATYYPQSGVILLSASVDLDGVEGMGLLVHQLVHHYQYTLGLHQEVSCKQSLEPLAFAIQTQFLRDNGHDAAADRMISESRTRSYCITSTFRGR